MKKLYLFIFIFITATSIYGIDNLIIRGKVIGVYNNYFEVEITKGSCEGTVKLFFDNPSNIPDEILVKRFLYENVSFVVDSNVCKSEMKIVDKLME